LLLTFTLLALFCVSLWAAEPAPAARNARAGLSGSARGAALPHDTGPMLRFCRPRGGAFVTSLTPDSRGAVAMTMAVEKKQLVTDTLEMFVLAKARPVHVRVQIRCENQTPTEMLRSRLRKAFTFFDRDGDGTLNGFEAEHIFSDTSLSTMMQNGYYQISPQDRPSLDRLDKDGDRRVSFAEFTAYYSRSTTQVLRPSLAVAQHSSSAQLTESLFKALDQNNDGKLIQSEVKTAEKLLTVHDSDEDECLSAAELNAKYQLNRGTQQYLSPTTPAVPQDVAVYLAGQVPGVVTQLVLKHCDRDGDNELSPAEVGFDSTAFRRLDTNSNGKLDGEELDEWRSGAADVEIRLSIASVMSDSKAEVQTPKGVLAERDFDLRQLEAGRLVLRVGRQSLEFSAFAPFTESGINELRNTSNQQFSFVSKGKDYVVERDLGGPNAPQTQFVRVLFDSADRNGDGRLTRQEFDQYFEAQQIFMSVGLVVTPAVTTPTLFQLLDEDSDGRLSVRELRMAWERLLPMEPPGSSIVTRDALQPMYSLRVSRALETSTVGSINNAGLVVTPRVPTKGPLWFRKMDRNGDGDVSRAEFLGSRAEFDQIDTDRDNLISLHEAEAFDGKLRR
jgi:Ca2+-binding EF-hand superfamily protein